MVKKYCYRLSIACVLLSAFLLAGCVDDKNLFDRDLTVTSENPTTLDYSTTRSVEIDMQYPDVPKGYAAVFDLYDQMPVLIESGQVVLKGELEPVASGISISGSFKMEKVLPRFVDELYAYSTHLFAPRLMHAKIVGNKAVFEVVDLTTLNTSVGRGAVTRNANNGDIDFYLGKNVYHSDLDANGKPNYIDESMHMNISSDVITRIEKAFPNHRNADEQYYQDASLYLQQEAKVWISMLLSDGLNVNELAYFCYDGPKAELSSLTSAQRAELKLVSIFPKAKSNIVGVGNYVQLKYYNKETGEFSEVFPAGTTIGWALRSIPQHGAPHGTLYSCAAWNPEKDANLRNHTIYFNAGTEELPFVCFGFEDMTNDWSWGWSDNDCNDLMFNIQMDPIDALDPPPVVEVPDEDLITYQNYKGFYGFEDWWPKYFDYDMNDVLVKYNSQVTYLKRVGETETYVTELNDVFSLIHTGAGHENVLGYKMEMDISLIESVYITESGAKPKARRQVTPVVDTKYNHGFIIDLCTEGARNVISPFDYEATPQVYTVELKFKPNAMKQADFEQVCAPYNPFIMAKNRADEVNGGPEVHLSRMYPTARVNPEFFGAQDDRSRPEEGLFYVGAEDNTYPFSIHVAGITEFFIPEEGLKISESYPKFTNWVASKMTEDNDWYKYPNTSIRGTGLKYE